METSTLDIAAETSAHPIRERRRRRREPKSGLEKKEARLGLWLVLPAVLVVFGLVLFPFAWNGTLAFKRVRLVELQDISIFGGDYTLANYERVTGVSSFWETVRNTLVYTIFGTVGSILVGLWAAIVMQKAFIGRSVVRGIMLFPYVAPVIAVTFAWKLMLSPQTGVANEWLEAAGQPKVDFLGRQDFVLNLGFMELTLPLALSTVILFEVWRYFPFAYLFLLARMQAIPKELDEAAIVDGATPIQRFRYITLPQLKAVLAVLFLLRFIWTFNKFDDVFLLTGGGSGTKVITVQILDWLRGRGDVGAASMLSLILAGILIVLVALYFIFFFRNAQEDET